jgi:hypothetical protein
MGITRAEKHNRFMDKVFSEAENEGRGLHGVYDQAKYKKAMLKKLRYSLQGYELFGRYERLERDEERSARREEARREK